MLICFCVGYEKKDLNSYRAVYSSNDISTEIPFLPVYTEEGYNNLETSVLNGQADKGIVGEGSCKLASDIHGDGSARLF